MVIKTMMKDLFPRFEEAELTDDEGCGDCAPGLEPLSDESDSDWEGDAQKESSSKEDEDVKMFLKLAETMSISSLLFILQGHARSMHNIPEGQLQKALDQAKEQKAIAQPQKPKVKKLRFAEIMGGQQIRVEVKEIPHFKTFTEEDKRDLWWTNEEQRRMRAAAAKVVRHFRTNAEFQESVELLADSYLDEVKDYEVEKAMKSLAHDYVCRGLETHIVKSLCEDQQASVQAVLNEQRKQQQIRDLRQDFGQHFDGDEQGSDPWECIRKKYQRYSMPCRTLAYKLAECDHVEALKASISKWSPKQPKQSKEPKRQLCRWGSS